MSRGRGRRAWERCGKPAAAGGDRPSDAVRSSFREAVRRAASKAVEPAADDDDDDDEVVEEEEEPAEATQQPRQARTRRQLMPVAGNSEGGADGDDDGSNVCAPAPSALPPIVHEAIPTEAPPGMACAL